MLLAATDTATGAWVPGRPASSQAAWNAASQSRGRCSLRGGEVAGWAARPEATTTPVSTSRTWTLQADVEESTPTTRGTSGLRGAIR